MKDFRAEKEDKKENFKQQELDQSKIISDPIPDKKQEENKYEKSTTP